MTANNLIWPGGFQFFWSSWPAGFKNYLQRWELPFHFPELLFYFLELPFCFLELPFCFPAVSFYPQKCPIVFQKCCLVFQKCLLSIYCACPFPRMFFPSWLCLVFFLLRAAQRDNICLALALFPLGTTYWPTYNALHIVSSLVFVCK